MFTPEECRLARAEAVIDCFPTRIHKLMRNNVVVKSCVDAYIACQFATPEEALTKMVEILVEQVDSLTKTAVERRMNSIHPIFIPNKDERLK